MPEISFATGHGTQLRAHLATPALGEGPWPGVVVIHEAFGLTDDIRVSTDRFGDAGYVAVAPDLFSHGGAIRCLKSTFAALVSGSGRAVDDIEATRAWTARRADCTGKVGVIGFCMGGGFALVVANKGFDASAPAYGQLPKDLDAALAGACPVVASYGGKDRGLKGAAGTLERHLTAAGVPHDVKEYAAAGHSFMNRDN
ncbi:MAG: carboxymethylenebutenolidase, partial [Frankiales bacterium]|nr:carboxymethylenebutenolidase [Frankiales bacterium]